MTTSSYCELQLTPGGEATTTLPVERWEIPADLPAAVRVAPNRPLEVTLRRVQAESPLRVRLEADEVFRLTEERESWTVQLMENLREQFGLAELTVEESSAGDPDDWSPVLTLRLEIEADPEFRRLHDALVAELEAVHLELARDFVSRTWTRAQRPGPSARPPTPSGTPPAAAEPLGHGQGGAPNPLGHAPDPLGQGGTADPLGQGGIGRGGAGRSGPARRGDVRMLEAESDLELLGTIYGRLERALQRIGVQPSSSLTRTRVISRWRPGDPIGSLAAQRMARGATLQRTADGQLHPPEKALMVRASLTTDIEEHRHLRAGLLRLAERSASLARHCSRAIDLFEEEESRWSGPALEAKTKTRLESLESTRQQAEELQERFKRLLGGLRYLKGLGPPRTALCPTPIFMGRPAYREAYRALRDARRQAGGRFDGETLRLRFRNLSTLYEYWLFVRVVGMLREMYGVPVGNRAFTLIDEVYRPELAPGQQFRFRLPRGDRLVATYEPDFPPIETRRTGLRYRSALVSGTLRPDVTLELTVAGRPPIVLALDAKSGPRFTKPLDRLRSAADYILLVQDPATGHQPIRQLFLVHRDTETGTRCNLSGYLEGRVSPPDSRVLGAIPARPQDTESLRLVILRFLETYRTRSSQ